MAGYVYFFETGDGLVKIGKANNVEARFKQIQTSCPTGLTNMGSIPSENPYKLEKKLHKYFKQYRKVGEWFAIPAELKNKNFVHHVRFRFDEKYAAEQREIEHQRVLDVQGYIESSGHDDAKRCPKCLETSHFFSAYITSIL